MTAPTQLEEFLGLLCEELVCDDSRRPCFVTCDSASTFRLPALLERHGLPHIDVGISEALGLGLAAGLAAEGRTAFVAAFAAFGTLRGAEPLRTLIDGEKADVVLLGGMAGLSAGPDGVSHHALEDLAFFRPLDSTRVYTPSDAAACRWVVADLLSQPGPAYVRLARVPVPSWPGQDTDGPLRWLTPRTNGPVVCGYGPSLLAAAGAFGEAGLGVGVLEFRRCQPLDASALRGALGGTDQIVVLEEHRAGGGLADRLREALGDVPVHEMAVAASPGSGTYMDLLNECGLAGPRAVERVRSVLRPDSAV
ncbi:transketolase C-terminal domain-containing protein [Actinomadura macrotermitis]|uniref:1-deoxy-D-xylulose-5-phosphate synthase n=1 Tax=Actinomadura macrotermitis TaxID=2585200 RepID=A0A7K0BV45_9ACTN|nr:transketolase C-terminal domain-containing protein [Actinomadura macrotermitis]MQY05033.1 1-deoxy-D-xylulose-5-phosphate synthase [Actinomadura macrotermitis]